MEKQFRISFKVIGISVRTTNENGQASVDIPNLWTRFMAEGILDKIPNKISNSIFSIYTDYEKDHTRPYTTFLGCEVSSIVSIPNGLEVCEISEGNFVEFVVKGKLAEGIVYHEWLKIWNTDLPRTYNADYEIYTPKSPNNEETEVAIFVGIE